MYYCTIPENLNKFLRITYAHLLEDNSIFVTDVDFTQRELKSKLKLFSEKAINEMHKFNLIDKSNLEFTELRIDFIKVSLGSPKFCR